MNCLLHSSSFEKAVEGSEAAEQQGKGLGRDGLRGHGEQPAPKHHRGRAHRALLVAVSAGSS